MSKQLRMYTVPSDIESVLAELRATVGLKIIEEISPSSTPIEVEWPLAKRSLWAKEKDFVSANCYLVPATGANIKMRFVTKQSHWIVHSEGVEGIEFSGCGYDGTTLIQGRFYFQKDMLIDDTVWSKRQEFIDWADKVFRVTKKQLHWSKDLQAYVGVGAEQFRQNGGIFATGLRPGGEPAE